MKKIFTILIISVLTDILCYSKDIIGDNWKGGDLICSNGDVLAGTFTNVGHFKIDSDINVFVFPQTKLVVYATTITISGKLNAIGRGGGGGIGGAIHSPGENGFGDGYGGGGGSEFVLNVATGHGGGGGGYGGYGGSGYGSLGGSSGTVYGSTTTIPVLPISSDDIYIGSGGGGGGGGNNRTGGTGGAGGGGIYLEAKYIIINGTITADGLEGGIAANIEDCTGNPGGGGGGSGGGILIKAIESLIISNQSNSLITANGGNGGSVVCWGGKLPMNPGGGGSGGRIKLLYNNYQTGPFSVIISTNMGIGGEVGDFSGTYANSGSSGTVSFGILPSSPTGFSIKDVFITSVTYSWDQKTSGWGGPVSQLPQLTTGQFRLYVSTPAMPFSDYFILSTSSNVTTATENELIPNTTIYRFLTAFTDYGDSMPSNEVSTWTYAAPPQTSQEFAFSEISSDSIKFTWSSGPFNGRYNPSYTAYEVCNSTAPDFNSGVSTTSFIIGLSSSPTGLSPNTTYYFRVRAFGLNNIYTSFSDTVSTATLAVQPTNPSFIGVYIDSVVVSWNSQNPPLTTFEVEISTDNFLTITTEAFTTSTTPAFGNLDPGRGYFLRVRALNRNNVPTNYSNVVSTTPGSSNTEPPPKPQPPEPTSKYSYDGFAKFVWYPVPNVYRWWLEIGTEPGANDFLSNYPLPGNILEYSTNTLVSGKTYYARVRAESFAGVLSEFSQPGPGVSVWISQTEPAILKPYNWPNPFDPALGPTNIGFNLKEAAKVTLKIFTLGGYKVYEETKYENSPGNYVFLWTGRNEDGKMVEPGGYIGVIIKHYSSGVKTQKFKIAVLY